MTVVGNLAEEEQRRKSPLGTTTAVSSHPPPPPRRRCVIECYLMHYLMYLLVDQSIVRYYVRWWYECVNDTWYLTWISTTTRLSLQISHYSETTIERLGSRLLLLMLLRWWDRRQLLRGRRGREDSWRLLEFLSLSSPASSEGMVYV